MYGIMFKGLTSLGALAGTAGAPVAAAAQQKQVVDIEPIATYDYINAAKTDTSYVKNALRVASAAVFDATSEYRFELDVKFKFYRSLETKYSSENHPVKISDLEFIVNSQKGTAQMRGNASSKYGYYKRNLKEDRSESYGTFYGKLALDITQSEQRDFFSNFDIKMKNIDWGGYNASFSIGINSVRIFQDKEMILYYGDGNSGQIQADFNVPHIPSSHRSEYVFPDYDWQKSKTRYETVVDYLSNKNTNGSHYIDEVPSTFFDKFREENFAKYLFKILPDSSQEVLRFAFNQEFFKAHHQWKQAQLILKNAGYYASINQLNIYQLGALVRWTQQNRVDFFNFHEIMFHLNIKHHTEYITPPKRAWARYVESKPGEQYDFTKFTKWLGQTTIINQYEIENAELLKYALKNTTTQLRYKYDTVNHWQKSTFYTEDLVFEGAQLETKPSYAKNTSYIELDYIKILWNNDEVNQSKNFSLNLFNPLRNNKAHLDVKNQKYYFK